MDIIKRAWEIQNRIEKGGFRLKHAVVSEVNKWHFKKSDKLIFFSIFLVCFAFASIVLFQTGFFFLYHSDWWLIPIGLGMISLFFFLKKEGETSGNG